ncbi:type IV pilin N-terminal domain-containing protein [Methanoregula sp.]|uniref:type IV pilin N-terminal domain-containing protein n=1 Tax=Methanoregula sp. TaxID=2052170 RepID=UPI002624F29E|nr:type IV pilin N-terminal domain-containing protein [Methanoregula sp.]MDD5144352.1 type IV pilin N-terminal domain-containing protein [Methanoregula sp.]
MQNKNQKNNTGVSEVVGEMLMIGLVLILVAVFSASLASYFPSERIPTVTIRVCNDTSGNITLWHKGGDWVKSDTLKVLVANTTEIPVTYTRAGDPRFVLVPDAQSFDLESNITVSQGKPLLGNESITLVTDRAVLFSGTVWKGMP